MDPPMYFKIGDIFHAIGSKWLKSSHPGYLVLHHTEREVQVKTLWTQCMLKYFIAYKVLFIPHYIHLTWQVNDTLHYILQNVVG